MRIVFLGTPQIAVPSLQSFIEREDIEVVAVITPPDKPAGRGKKLTPSPVKVVAQEHNIPVYQPKSIRKDEELIRTLKELNPDLFITVAFGQILSQEVLDIPSFATINLHVSLLPKYRGANPLQWAVVNGDKTTGVTTMITVLELDAGPILMSEEIEITENMTSSKVAQKSAEIGPNILYRSMQGLINGTITPKQQNNSQATFAPKIKKEEGVIDWSDTAQNIHNKVRGMKPFPATTTTFRDETVKIIETRILDKTSDKQSGEIINISKQGVEISTGDGVILITQIQPPNKKAMDARSWANGFRIKVGEIFIKKED